MNQHFDISLPNDITDVVQRALTEDIQTGDINAQLIPVQATAKAQVICREAARLCGTAWFNEVFKQLDQTIQIQWQATEGSLLTPNQVICYLEGKARTLLSGERTALNFLQLLSGTATSANHYAALIQHTSAQILDTRKTLPNLRSAQKYAVHCGGGKNHRMGLYDEFLIKENHIIAAGSITQAVIAARQIAPHLPLEVEVETLSQIEEALAIGVERLLLDNFTIAQLREAVNLVQGKAKLEASGGITREVLVAIAETGIDYISIGAITKDVKAVDFSMRILEIHDTLTHL